MGRGAFLSIQKKNELAIADLTKAIEINPYSVLAYLAYSTRGRVYESLKKWDLALAILLQFLLFANK